MVYHIGMIFSLTGGIASGKSTVSKVFAEEGVGIVDADLIAREVVQPGSSGLRRLVKVFGDGILQADGQLDRKKLGTIVFGSKNELAKLNWTLMPEIFLKVGERVHEVKKTYSMVCLDAPTLIENNLLHYRPIVLVVTSPEEQLRRVMARGFSAEEAAIRIESQLSVKEKMEVADYLLENHSSVEELQGAARKLLKHLRGLDTNGVRQDSPPS